MNDFSDLFSANSSAMEAENGELGDIIGCGSFPFDQSDLFSEEFSVKQAENRELCDSVGYGLLPFDAHGSSAQLGFLACKKGENEELFDGHGSSDGMVFRDYPFNLRIAQGNDKKSRVNYGSEKVRRQRMNSCFSELASLLPSQNSTKKNVSKLDIVCEAIHYIHHLKKKVDGISKKRDKMKMMVNNYQLGNNSYSSCKEGNQFPIVNIDHVCSHILITINTVSKNMVLSKILVVIEEQHLQLINMSSFSIHEKVTHTIHCKVPHITKKYNNINLGQKIWQMIREK